MVNDWKVKSSASRLELQQLLGILNLMSGCIISGRLFVSRMLSDLREAYKVEPKRVQLSQGFQMVAVCSGEEQWCVHPWRRKKDH